MLGIAIGVIIMGGIALAYVSACVALYPVYRVTGGKLGFFTWWKKMRF